MSLGTGVDTHKKPNTAQLGRLSTSAFFWKAATLQHNVPWSDLLSRIAVPIVGQSSCKSAFSGKPQRRSTKCAFPFSFLACQGCGGVFGRALTKRAWMSPNKPEEKNKKTRKSEKARKEEKGAGGAGRALTKRA